MKKFLRIASLLLVLVTALSTASLMSAFALEVEDYYLSSDAFYGDTDNDLKITVKDATSIQKHLAKLIELERKSQLVADVDGNGKLTISDATDIQKYLANIIHCFEAAPTQYCEADGEAVRIELTTEEPEKVTVKIPKAGYYRFMSRKVEGGTCCFEIYDGTSFIDWAYGDASVVETYIHLSAGRYTVYLEPSWEYEKDVADFSVTSANDKMPIDISNAQEINPGDKIEIKAGEGEQIFKFDPAKLEIPDEGMMIYTEGDTPEVSIEKYNDYLQSSSYFDYEEDGYNVKATLFSAGYIVVKAEEGGSDFTLCCDGYSGYVDRKATVIELDEKQDVEMTEVEYSEGTQYRSNVMRKFIPDESGYYKLAIDCQETLFVVNTIGEFYYGEIPECFAFLRFGFSETEPYSSYAYLEAGKTYYVVFVAIDWYGNNQFSFTLTKSAEDACENWYNEVYSEEEEGMLESECTELTLGKKEFVTISSELGEYGWYEPVSKMFKFTADKDMTVVAYSEDSYDADVWVYDENGKYVGWSNDSGDLSSDFTAVIDLKTGESCYFEISSNDCYDYDDSFYFSVVDIEDYKPIS